MGESSAACCSTGSTVSARRKLKTSASGKLCCSANEIFRPLSVAAACNSKLKLTQKRLRSANPQALLMRAPKGAWITNCMPPPSSKKRSAIMVCCVGTAPSTARLVTTYSTICSAAESSRPHSLLSHATAAANSAASRAMATGDVWGVKSLTCCRNSAISRESSAVRAGASPSQKGMLGAAPCASSTSTRPALSMRRMRQEVLPSRITSPFKLSTAKSSSIVPTTVPSGSATTE